MRFNNILQSGGESYVDCNGCYHGGIGVQMGKIRGQDGTP